MTVDTHSVAGDTNTGAVSYKAGLKITTNAAITLQTITFMSSDNSTKAYIYNTAGDLLASAAISGGAATFSQALANGTAYYLFGDGDGASVTHRYQSTAGFPFNRTNVNFIQSNYNPTIPTDMEAGTDTANVWSVYSVTSIIPDVTVTPSALTLSTTNQTPVITVLIIPSALTMTSSIKDIWVYASSMTQVVVGTGSSGSRFIANRYPVVDGLTAGTTKQTGHKESLVPTMGTLVSRRNRL